MKFVNCGLCYQMGTAELRWDKYGRPWVLCGACGARTFTRTPNALRGIYMTSRLVEAARRQVEADPVERERRERDAEAFVQSVRAERSSLSNGVAPMRGEGDPHEQALPTSAAK